MSSISQEKRIRIFERSGGVCSYCGDEITLNGFHVEHMLPQSRGGSNDDDNLVASCRRCNMAKSSQTPLEWVETLHARSELCATEFLRTLRIVGGAHGFDGQWMVVLDLYEGVLLPAIRAATSGASLDWPSVTSALKQIEREFQGTPFLGGQTDPERRT